MSWFARSLVNSLRGEEEEDEDEDDANIPKNGANEEQNSNRSSNAASINDEEDEDPTRGVKEDLSELTKTLTRQFWGVASFLAPPPPSSVDSPPSDHGQRSDPTVSDEPEDVISPRLAGIRSDFAELGGRFKSGISMLSSTKAVSEISKIASTLLPFGEEEEDEEESEEVEERYEGGAVGVTDDVLAFARNISMHPETWLDFPLIPDEDESEEFDMSDAQQEHALAVERYAPRLAALRIELCPSHMSEGHFWKIYFVLLHSRLNRHDADLLTTSQIMQARAMLLQDLQTRAKPKSEEVPVAAATSPPKEATTSVAPEEIALSPLDTSFETSSTKALIITDEPSSFIPITELETKKHPLQTTEVKIIDKSVIEEDPAVELKVPNLNDDNSRTISIQKYEEGEGDEWLQEEDVDEVTASRGATISLGNEEDVSFSDLEEDDDDQGTPSNSKRVNSSIDSQPKGSKEEWVQLNKDAEATAKGGVSTSHRNKDSNDWLNIDDLDEEL